MERRTFLKQSVSVVIATVISFLGSKTGQAAWLAKHFASGQFNESMVQLFDNQAITESSQINIGLPKIAENGAVVPITISSELENIERIYILVEKNPTPLAAEFELSAKVSVYITTRIKMAESCNVVVIAKLGSQLLKSQQWVNVVQGGCGTG